jgi:hypothetical protein
LNDNTRIGPNVWSDLRDNPAYNVMEPGYETQKWFITLGQEDKKYLKGLIEAQNRQGDR